jgi:DNA-binding transcriptional regulator YbjK
VSEAASRTNGFPPPGVPERLARLRALYVPESDKEARRRLATEQPRRREPFATAVARRLAELRALDDLGAHLGRRRRAGDS